MAYVVDTKTTKVHKVLLSGDELIDLIGGGQLMDNFGARITIPETAEVSFRVPGGGDWSNTTIEVDVDCPICIQWEEKS